MTVVRCGECGLTLNEQCDIQPGKRTLCPSCGSTNRAYAVTINEKLLMYSSVGIKAKRPNQKRPFIEQFSGVDLWRKLKKLVNKNRTIDRDSDSYEEQIKDIKTGEIIHSCKEPLSKHLNHGSAKHKE